MKKFYKVYVERCWRCPYFSPYGIKDKNIDKDGCYLLMKQVNCNCMEETDPECPLEQEIAEDKDTGNGKLKA